MTFNDTYPAKRVTIHAVYYKFTIFGNKLRSLEAAFPDRVRAEKYVKDRLAEMSWAKPTDYMIEEMPATMQAWDGV